MMFPEDQMIISICPSTIPKNPIFVLCCQAEVFALLSSLPPWIPYWTCLYSVVTLPLTATVHGTCFLFPSDPYHPSSLLILWR